MRYRYIKKPNGELIRSAQIFTVEEHNINKNNVDPLAAYICEKLNKEGYETFIVGGAARDLLLKKIPKDFDIASAATPSRIKKIFSNSRVIGKRFRLVHIFFGEKIFEIATFRSMQDGLTGNTFGPIEEDVQRRDFTMNALFYDPRKELVIDFVGGFNDINKKIVKPIIPLNDIFKDDPVRMIRAVKYAVLAGFSLPFFLRKKIKQSAFDLKKISPSRLTEEISKIIKSPCSLKIIEELETLGLYVYLQPKASKLLKSSYSFRKRYFNSFSKLNTESAKTDEEYMDTLTDGLSALVRDYIDDVIDWKTANQETYKTAFIAARKFVLPMNPPRMELSKAIRNIFAEHSITVQRWRILGRF